jgi:hypothetical protein
MPIRGAPPVPLSVLKSVRILPMEASCAFKFNLNAIAELMPSAPLVRRTIVMHPLNQLRQPHQFYTAQAGFRRYSHCVLRGSSPVNSCFRADVELATVVQRLRSDSNRLENNQVPLFLKPVPEAWQRRAHVDNTQTVCS